MHHGLPGITGLPQQIVRELPDGRSSHTQVRSGSSGEVIGARRVSCSVGAKRFCRYGCDLRRGGEPVGQAFLE
jgi:hypothetical protein